MASGMKTKNDGLYIYSVFRQLEMENPSDDDFIYTFEDYPEFRSATVKLQTEAKEITDDIAKFHRNEYIWNYCREECVHYLLGCKMGNTYDCFAWDGCMLAPENSWSNCARGCLLNKRIAKGPGFGGKPKDHWDCFWNCRYKTDKHLAL